MPRLVLLIYIPCGILLGCGRVARRFFWRYSGRWIGPIIGETLPKFLKILGSTKIWEIDMCERRDKLCYVFEGE